MFESDEVFVYGEERAEGVFVYVAVCGGWMSVKSGSFLLLFLVK